MAESSEVRLLGAWSSPFVMRARIALNIKHVNYAFHQEDLWSSKQKKREDLWSKSELLLKSNPVHRKIPVLIHGDKPICESLLIVQYIDEVWSSGPSILPSDPYDRATARFWAAYLDDKWFSALYGLATAQGEEEKKALVDQLAEGIVLLEEEFGKCSKGKPFFSGDRIGYLDIAFGSYLAWIRVTEKFNGRKLIDQAKTPKLAKWAERFCQDPAVNGLVPETENFAVFAETLFAKMRGAN